MRLMLRILAPTRRIRCGGARRTAQSWLASMLLVAAIACLATGCRVGRDAEAPRAYAYEWRSWAGPTTLEAGKGYRFAMDISNTGAAFWSARSGVRLGYHVYDQSGLRGLRFGNDLTELPANVPPGGHVGVWALVFAPEEPGAYRLRFDLFNLHVAWFEEYGNTPLEVPITVVPRTP